MGYELTPKRIFGYLDFNFAGTGLISGQRLCSRLDQHLGDRNIEDLPTRFTAVATEIGTGHEHWLSRGRLVDAVRASYALPGVFRPVKVNNRWLFDGALVNPIPVSVCRALGARYVIAVNLNFDILGRGSVISTPEMSTPTKTTSLLRLSTKSNRKKGVCALCFSGRSSDAAMARQESRGLWSMLSISSRTASHVRVLLAILLMR